MPLPIGRLDREAGASACKEGYVGPVPGLLFLSDTKRNQNQRRGPNETLLKASTLRLASLSWKRPTGQQATA